MRGFQNLPSLDLPKPRDNIHILCALRSQSVPLDSPRVPASFPPLHVPCSPPPDSCLPTFVLSSACLPQLPLLTCRAQLAPLLCPDGTVTIKCLFSVATAPCKLLPLQPFYMYYIYIIIINYILYIINYIYIHIYHTHTQNHCFCAPLLP